jgi:hypothetical protein
MNKYGTLAPPVARRPLVVGALPDKANKLYDVQAPELHEVNPDPDTPHGKHHGDSMTKKHAHHPPSAAAATAAAAAPAGGTRAPAGAGADAARKRERLPSASDDGTHSG